MKSFLVLGFCLAELVFVSGSVLNDTSSFPQRRATTFQNLSPKILYLPPQSKEEQRIGKIMYLKQLLKLKCFKKIFNDIRNENRLRFLNPYRINKPVQVSPLKNYQNHVLLFHQMRPNILSVEPPRSLYFGKNPILLSPNREKYIPKQINRLPPKKTPQTNSSEIAHNQKPENLTEKKQNTKFIQTPPSVIDRDKSTEKLRENLRAFTLDEDIPRTITPESTPKPNDKLNSEKATPITQSVDRFQQQTKPVQTHGVTESVREKIIIDFSHKNNTEDYKNGKTSSESTILRKEPGRSEIKSSNTNLGMSTILRTLTESGNSSTKKSKEIYHNSSARNSYLASNSNKLNTYSDNRPEVYIKKIIEIKSTSREQPKQLKITLPYVNETNRNSKETITKTTVKTDNDFATTLKVEKVKAFTKKVTPSDALKTKKWSDSAENPQITTTVPEIQTSDYVRDLDTPKGLLSSTKPTMSTLLPFTVTETANLTTSEKAIPENESFLVTLPKTQTTPSQEVTKGFVNEKYSNSSDKTTKHSEITENFRKIKIGKAFPEEGLTLPIFTEFTDLPITIDLLTGFKKDQDNVLKNSRKMHFNKEVQTTTTTTTTTKTTTTTTTTPNQVSAPENSEQRRSDILIDDSLDDYLLDDSGSSLNYLKQLKQKNAVNSSSDSMIQLIPFVINDLREDRISSEDIPILSKAFGKHWKTVLALTNNTDLDMLPLLKMKDEKDLNNILRTFFPENFQVIAAESKEIYRDNYMEYYYEDEYETLREDHGKLGEKEKTYRFKRDEEGSRYFEATEGDQNIVINKYRYESGLNINEHYETSLETNKSELV